MADKLTLVTGASGFIGSNIAIRLAADGVDVVACDRFTQADSWRYLAPILVHDIVEPEALLDWLHLHSGDVTTIVHMGAISSTTETNVAKIIKNNIRLTLDLWEFAAEHGTDFIYASSAATYGDGSVGFVDDGTPAGLARLHPLNAYGWSKHFVDRRIADDVVRGRPSPVRWAGLKFFNVYGPNEGHKGPMRSVVHQIYPVAMRDEPVRLFRSENPAYPDGGQLRDFVYVKDCAEIVLKILHMPSVSGLFNAGTGVARSFEDLANAVFLAAEREPRIEYIDMPAELRGKYQYFTEADTAKLRAEGLAPEFFSLEAGVADYVRSGLAEEFRGRPETS